MNKKIVFIVVGLLFSITLTAQNLTVVVNYVAGEGRTDRNKIYYQAGQLLDWDDFNGKPVAGTDAAALTSAGFGLKLMFRRVENNSQLVISVNCCFSRKDSWVLPGNKSAYILNHEQKHFDITYIHTILFIHNLKSAKITNANYKAVLEKLYNESAAALGEIQNRYDAETGHSKLPAKQAEWDEKINRQLALYAKE